MDVLLALNVAEVEPVLVESNNLGRLHAFPFQIDIGLHASVSKPYSVPLDLWLFGDVMHGKRFIEFS